jgi:hypothetical protein
LAQECGEFQAIANSLECSEILAPISVRIIARRLRPFVKRHEIVYGDFARANAVEQFFYFLLGGFEVELAKGHLRPADGIADSLLQLLSAGFALGAAEFFQGTAQLLAFEPR